MRPSSGLAGGRQSADRGCGPRNQRAFARAFGSRARSPTRFVDLVWSAQEWTRGAYGSYNPPGALTQLGRAAHRPAGRIHWANAELAHQWPGYMDGAIESGERTAREVLRRLA